eukprot:10426678-Alexandrium_andersonii.AAC.1
MADEALSLTTSTALNHSIIEGHVQIGPDAAMKVRESALAGSCEAVAACAFVNPSPRTGDFGV